MLIMTPIEMGDDYNEHLQDVGQAKCLADNMYFEARNQGTLVSLLYQMLFLTE